MANEKELAAAMREAAAMFRKEAQEIDSDKSIKCAQVLTAARGLEQLQTIIKGATNER